MKAEEIEKLKIALRCGIDDAKNDDPNFRSWPAQEGVLITRNEAEYFLSLLSNKESEEEKEIYFSNHLWAKIKISNNTPEVLEAIDGWGDNIKLEAIEITPSKD